MYESFFGFTELPFSIAPNPSYLFMSAHHREAMAHLLFGVREGGGFVQLTGEVGTGKTTLCRQLLTELPDNVDVALILNPRINELELMQSVCDELRIKYDLIATVKHLLDKLNDYLLSAHARGRNTVLIIDEAQNLSEGVLEQVRLLTNLETSQKKLLQIILVGQTELRDMLSERSLRQLSQRITARYHLKPLDRKDLREYLRYRLKQSGCERFLFTRPAVSAIYRLSNGIPRIINVLCDRALLGAYAKGSSKVNLQIIRTSGFEVQGIDNRLRNRCITIALLLILLLSGLVFSLNKQVLPTKIDQHLKSWIPEWIYTVPSHLSRNNIGNPALISIAHAAETDINLTLKSNLNINNENNTSAQHYDYLPVTLSAEQLQEELNNIGVDNLSRINALRNLVSQWKLPTTIVSDCVTVTELGLKCYGFDGDLATIRQLNRPIMILTEFGGVELGYVIVRSVSGNNVHLRYTDKTILISAVELKKIWKGNALMLWKPPALDRIPIDENSSVDDILWLRRALKFEQMNYGISNLQRIDRAVLDAEFLDALNQFQQRVGLPLQSKADVNELIHLNSRVKYDFFPILESN